jgi:hypothetical protein
LGMITAIMSIDQVKIGNRILVGKK